MDILNSCHKRRCEIGEPHFHCFMSNCDFIYREVPSQNGMAAMNVHIHCDYPMCKITDKLHVHKPLTMRKICNHCNITEWLHEHCLELGCTWFGDQSLYQKHIQSHVQSVVLPKDKDKEKVYIQSNNKEVISDGEDGYWKNNNETVEFVDPTKMAIPWKDLDLHTILNTFQDLRDRNLLTVQDCRDCLFTLKERIENKEDLVFCTDIYNIINNFATENLKI